MKALLAACIALGWLWYVDQSYNSGRYSDVVQRAAMSLMAG